MTKASKSATSLYKIAGLAVIAFASTNTIAQNAQGNVVNVASPDICAAACGRDNMCASWTFRPNPVVNGQSAGGQCQFSKPNQNNVNGNVNFVQARPSVNVPNWTQSSIPTWQAPSPRGGNYAVTPLPNHSAPQARVASLPSQMAPSYSPRPVAPQNSNPNMTNNGASISFERPTNAAHAPQYSPPAQQKIDWRPVAAPAPQPQISQPAPQVSQSANLNAYRAPDGTVDAAQMRRDQLAAQNRSGQPRYSVQGEWSGVAQSVATGQNQTGIDWANTTPIPQPQEQRMTPRNETANSLATQSRGPLRARKQQASQSENSENSEPKKGLFESLGSIFGGNRQSREDTINEVSPQESGHITAMHGPLRKRAPSQ